MRGGMNTSPHHEESTYALLVRSEEKERSFLEILVYTLCIFSAIAAIYQFAHQPVPVATPNSNDPSCLACVTPIHSTASTRI